MKGGKESPKTYVIEVIPLTKTGSQTNLSYFSTTRLSSGTIVKVPLRNKEIKAVVVSSKSALSAKSELRQAGYALKKIGQKNIYNASFSPEFLQAVKETGTYFASTEGSLINALIPKVLIDEPAHFFPVAPTRKKSQTSTRDTFLLQMEPEERFGQYRALVRQCFARGASVMIVVPTHFDAERAEALLSQGISEYVFTFTLKGKTGEQKRVWRKALEETHPILFITTPAGLSFERKDLDTIVIERENSRVWRTLTRPYFHFKYFLEKLSKITKRQLVLGDSVLSLEVLWREKRGEYGELSLIRWRLPAAPTALVDASARPDTSGKFEIFSPELKSLIERALEEKVGIFLFGARKGLAPTTVCGDCGFVLPCLNCGAPVVLHHKNTGETVYICHACGNKRDSHTTCGFCGSWKLVPLGIGVERIAAEARQLFHNTHVAVLDKDHATTDARAKSIAKSFSENGGILVGTELALFYLEKSPYVGLVSADSLFSIPDFAINERLFYLVSRLREMAEKEALIQTRNIGKQILAWGAQGNIIDFYLGEIGERQELLYPPFSVFIKVTSHSTHAIQEVALLRERFYRWHPDCYKDSLIIRVPRTEWPDPELSEALTLLGPQFSIRVDPESIL